MVARQRPTRREAGGALLRRPVTCVEGISTSRVLLHCWCSAAARARSACRRVVSGSLSLPARGGFSPVPHGTRPLSVTQESFALEGGPPGFAPDFSGRALLRTSAAGRPSPSPTGLSPPLAPRSRGLRLASRPASAGPTTPAPQRGRFGLRPVRSPLLGASRLIPLPQGTEMFQFPWFASPRTAGR